MSGNEREHGQAAESRARLAAKQEAARRQEREAMRPKLNPRKAETKADNDALSADFVARQKNRFLEREKRLAEKRERQAAQEREQPPPVMTEYSRKLMQTATGGGSGRDASMRRLTMLTSPRKEERLAQLKKERAAQELVTNPVINERSRELVMKTSSGQSAQGSRQASMERLTRQTKSASAKKRLPGEMKEVVVYRGWSRHIEYLPVDSAGRIGRRRTNSQSDGLNESTDDAPPPPSRDSTPLRATSPKTRTRPTPKRTTRRGEARSTAAASRGGGMARRSAAGGVTPAATPVGLRKQVVELSLEVKKLKTELMKERREKKGLLGEHARTDSMLQRAVAACEAGGITLDLNEDVVEEGAPPTPTPAPEAESLTDPEPPPEGSPVGRTLSDSDFQAAEQQAAMVED